MDDSETPSVGKAAGGHARAKSLSPEERSEIAKKAAAARWSPAGPVATHEGLLKIGNADIPCYVLENGERVLSTRGIMKALGRTWRGRKYTGTELPVFLEANNLKPFINNELGAVLAPRQIRTHRGTPSEAFPAEILPVVCDIYLRARETGALTGPQQTIAQQCEILVRALSRVGIIALVDEATGFQAVRPRDALQEYLERLIRKDLAVWAKKFPDEFYENIYKLRGWVWPGMNKNRYSVVAHYTRDLVYERMAPGLLKELEAKTPKDDKGNRDNKLHQWLSGDVGDPMLASHLQSILTLQRLALANGWGWQKFMHMVDQIMKKKGQTLDLPFTSSETSDPLPPSSQSPTAAPE